MNFYEFMCLCNHHPEQNTEHFHPPQESSFVPFSTVHFVPLTSNV